MLLLSRPRPMFKLHADGIHLRDSKLHRGSTITVATSMGWTPHSPNKTLNVTAVGVLHTTELPQYHGLPGLDAVAQRIPGVVNYLVRCVGLLLQRSTVPDGPILRTWVRSPLDYACNVVVSLNWRPFLLSHLKCGSHVELLEFLRGLECLQVKTRRSVPFLIDMKIFYALSKMSFGARYAPWHVD